MGDKPDKDDDVPLRIEFGNPTDKPRTLSVLMRSSSVGLLDTNAELWRKGWDTGARIGLVVGFALGFVLAWAVFS